MLDHVGFGVTDYAASKDFFLRALKPLGVRAFMDGPYGLGLGQNDKPHPGHSYASRHFA